MDLKALTPQMCSDNGWFCDACTAGGVRCKLLIALEQAQRALEAAAKEIKDLDADVAEERAKHKAAFNAGMESARQASVYREQLEQVRTEEKRCRESEENAIKRMDEMGAQLERAQSDYSTLSNLYVIACKRLKELGETSVALNETGARPAATPDPGAGEPVSEYASDTNKETGGV